MQRIIAFHGAWWVASFHVSSVSPPGLPAGIRKRRKSRIGGIVQMSSASSTLAVSGCASPNAIDTAAGSVNRITMVANSSSTFFSAPDIAPIWSRSRSSRPATAGRRSISRGTITRKIR